MLTKVCELLLIYVFQTCPVSDNSFLFVLQQRQTTTRHLPTFIHDFSKKNKLLSVIPFFALQLFLCLPEPKSEAHRVKKIKSEEFKINDNNENNPRLSHSTIDSWKDTRVDNFGSPCSCCCWKRFKKRSEVSFTPAK